MKSNRMSSGIGLCAAILVVSGSAFAKVSEPSFMAPLERLKKLGVPVLASDSTLGLGVAHLSESQRETLSKMAHDRNECGGYRLLLSDETIDSTLFSTLRAQNTLNKKVQGTVVSLQKNALISTSVEKVSADNLFQFVKWYSSFQTRYERDRVQGMTAVNALKERLEQMTASVRSRVSVEFVTHEHTPQNSIRVSFKGAERPQEIVVAGGHLDSVNWEVRGGRAPGADDNGSGTSNLVELVRILVESPAPARTVDVFFYAAEETGLVGSSEIARTYNVSGKDVIGVMQLDMTLHPGAGEGVIGFTRDYTSAWLNSYLEDLNRLYVGATIIDDRCDYACSDHASWHSRGFPATFPFEATMNTSNPEIHTERDAINNTSSFKHSALFSKLAVAFTLDLANSTLRAPSK